MRFSNVLSVVLLALFASACQTVDPEQQTYTTTQAFDLRDSDNDGVINSRDICGDSPADGIIDERGCALWEMSERHTDFEIFFDFDSVEIKLTEIDKIREVKNLIATNDATHIYLVGDTSDEGDSEYNQKLGKRRADAVTEELLSQGVSSERIRGLVYSDDLVKKLLKKRQRRTIIRIVYLKQEYLQEWSIYKTENLKNQ